MMRVLPIFLVSFISFTARAQKMPTATDWFERGKELTGKGAYLEATVALRNALALDKYFDSAYLQMADAFGRINKGDSAVLYLRKLAKLRPQSKAANLSIANIYKNVISDVDSALLYYKKTLQLDSTDKTVWCNIAWCYNAQKKYDDAIFHAIKSLDIDNKYRPAYGELGHAYHQSQRYAEGIEQFKKNLAVSVVDLPIYYTALCYMMLKDTDNAMKQYEELKRVNEKLAEGLKKRIDKMLQPADTPQSQQPLQTPAAPAGTKGQ